MYFNKTHTFVTAYDPKIKMPLFWQRHRHIKVEYY